MSWNKPSSVPRPPPKKSAPPSLKRGLLAGLLVVALGALGYFMFRPSAATPKRDSAKDRGLIKEVTPAVAPKPREKTHAEKMRERYPNLTIPDDWEKPYPPPAYRADGSLKRWSRYVICTTASVNRANMSLGDRTFDNRADRAIASALMMKPGMVVVGNIEYGEKFVQDFLESIKTPIIATKDDDEETRELKRLVNETKIELKARYDAGEDIAAIMNETRKQYQELGLYREELKKLVREAKRGADGELSHEDHVDLIKAANKMLEERGCKPLALPEQFAEKVERDFTTDENNE